MGVLDVRLDNPYPKRPLATIVLEATDRPLRYPLLLAITLESVKTE